MQADIISRLKMIAVPPEFTPRNLVGLISPMLIYITVMTSPSSCVVIVHQDYHT